MGKYLAVTRIGHPKSTKEGAVYIHVLQAEKQLGRYLNTEECVHHIDGDKYNNDIDNLMVFKTISDHVYFHHNSNIPLKCYNGVWEVDEEYKKNKTVYRTKLCPVCNENFCVSSAKKCLKCHREEEAKRVPERTDIKQMVRKDSFESLGRKLGVSGKAISKWCIKYNLPYRKKDIMKYTDEEWNIL